MSINSSTNITSLNNSMNLEHLSIQNPDEQVLKAVAYNKKGEYELALKAANDGLEILQDAGADPRRRADLFRQKAIAHNEKGEYDLALEAANDGLEILQDAGADPTVRADLFRQKAFAYNEKAFAHNEKGEYELAIEAANDGLQIQEADPMTRADLF
nr:hypothetical protein [Chlamydiota bacterium]